MGTKAAMTLKEEKTVACEAGFTRVCPSGANGACPEGMFNFCPYSNSPGATADDWPCSCLQSRMLELDIQAGLNPLSECHGECICINKDIEAITKKQKPTFFGPKEMPSYCNSIPLKIKDCTGRNSVFLVEDFTANYSIDPS